MVLPPSQNGFAYEYSKQKMTNLHHQCFSPWVGCDSGGKTDVVCSQTLQTNWSQEWICFAAHYSASHCLLNTAVLLAHSWILCWFFCYEVKHLFPSQRSRKKPQWINHTEQKYASLQQTVWRRVWSEALLPPKAFRAAPSLGLPLCYRVKLLERMAPWVVLSAGSSFCWSALVLVIVHRFTYSLWGLKDFY